MMAVRGAGEEGWLETALSPASPCVGFAGILRGIRLTSSPPLGCPSGPRLHPFAVGAVFGRRAGVSSGMAGLAYHQRKLNIRVCVCVVGGDTMETCVKLCGPGRSKTIEHG
eukprot:TRINITY_DN73183_c0_g1_i1.p1 TRINITY_DN73183_c0_g1~~TRINITY_DN73183_c0_g1_i1.p1  ORF type:complete len:111 (+),score=3.81 TRINITY_DN73183_c0_g1_i1:339-671(+)